LIAPLALLTLPPRLRRQVQRDQTVDRLDGLGDLVFADTRMPPLTVSEGLSIVAPLSVDSAVDRVGASCVRIRADAGCRH
jgi:hypothetical protein